MRARLPFVLALASSVYGLANVERNISTNYHHVCNTIAAFISSASAVFYPGKLSIYPSLISGIRGGVYRQCILPEGHIPLCQFEHATVCMHSGTRNGGGCWEDCK